MKKIAGYGVNISYGPLFERLASFSDECTAKKFYNLMLLSEETKFGARVDLEKIYEAGGDYEYEVILKNYN